jgi:hypothetical protein
MTVAHQQTTGTVYTPTLPSIAGRAASMKERAVRLADEARQPSAAHNTIRAGVNRL